VAAAAAVATLEVMLGDGFLQGVRERGEYLAGGLTSMVSRFPELASGVRGLGLIRGLVLTDKGIRHGAHIVNAMFEKGFLINFAGNVVLRFVPPLIVSTDQMDQLLAALTQTLTEIGA